ncbi:hypothetical protein [Streptomyces nodosus]|uniref:Uncharacterized protein n=1 Tax=Streptomyces nodosus TaxID=40318 RepID=A0A0B5DLK6_9ACTN|nr:hypothetical protein [Streptomyces nodosus]AJE41321.1 hypothetical protein SNOD_15710 [Streptomyces nodosus]MBB4792487.1 hypothetical protein [Streptomyces nodosus]QEV39862.1 hypothetical protein CP978_16005 [Streptomyces nodosus]
MTAQVPAVIPAPAFEEQHMPVLVGDPMTAGRFTTGGADVLLGPAGTLINTEADDEPARSGVWNAEEFRLIGPAPAPVTERLLEPPWGADQSSLPIRSPYRKLVTAMRSTPHPSPALGSEWTATLVIDALCTLVSATTLTGIGVLIPAFDEDYDMPMGRHVSEAVPFFGGMALLVTSLIITTLMVRSSSERRRRTGLVTATVRLGCLVTAAIAFVVYGTVTYGV